MPLIMDEQNQDFDDLFDDPNSALPSTTHNPASIVAAARRLDELSLSGACQKLTWSNSGSIAAITGDGQMVNVQNLIRVAGKAEFDLSNNTKLEMPKNRFQYPLAHVSWSPGNPTGVLLVVDSTGNFALYTTYFSCNALKPTALLTFEDHDANSGCVCVHWLRTSKQLPPPGCVRSATKSGETWNYQAMSEKLFGPCCPFPNVSSFLAVTRCHTVRLCFQGMNAPWTHVSETIGSCASIEDMFTHASFAPYKENSMLLAALDFSMTLRVYEVTVQWNIPAELRAPPAGFQFQPSLRVTCLKVLQDFTPDVPNVSAVSVKPCNLCIMPKLDGIEGASKPPTIHAIYTIVDQMQAQANMPIYSSKLVTCTMNETSENLHSSFTSMAAAAGKQLGNTSKSAFSLTKLTDIDLHGLVMTAIPQRADTMLMLVKSDASANLFDRISHSILECDISTDTIRHPLQAAYIFPAEDNSPETCLSSNGCILAKRETNDTITLKRMDKVFSSVDDRALASLTILAATSSFFNTNNEDVLDRLWSLAETTPPTPILLDIFRSLAANFDFAADDSQHRINMFLLNTLVTKSLSLLETLPPRSIPTKVATTMLEIRAMCTNLQLALSTPPEQMAALDLAASLQGVVSWFTTLTAFLIDDVLALRRTVGASPTLDAIHAQLESSRSPAPALLLCSSPRMLLRVACRFLRTFAGRDNKIAALIPPKYQGSWDQLVHTAANSPVDILKFEEFLQGLNHYAKAAYDEAKISDPQRSVMEREFLVTGQIPAQLEGVAQRLVTTSVDRLVEGGRVDPLVLFCTDVSGLGLVDGDGSVGMDNGAGGLGVLQKRMGARTKKICVYRKIELAPGLERWKRCTRCARLTEDLTDGKTMPMWLQRAQRQCVCGSSWIVVEG